MSRRAAAHGIPVLPGLLPWSPSRTLWTPPVNTVSTSIYNERPKSDKVLVDIVDYVTTLCLYVLQLLGGRIPGRNRASSYLGLIQSLNR